MSQEIQEAVYKQQEVIKDKQLSVKQDLDQVEPAVIEAQNGTVLEFIQQSFNYILLLSESELELHKCCLSSTFFLYKVIPAMSGERTLG